MLLSYSDESIDTLWLEAETSAEQNTVETESPKVSESPDQYPVKEGQSNPIYPSDMNALAIRASSTRAPHDTLGVDFPATQTRFFPGRVSGEIILEG